jgi:hypothetical protein
MIEVSYDAAVVLTWLSVLLVGGFFLWLYLSIRNSWRGSSDAAFSSLLRNGYRDISELTKDAEGKWIGTATKDGKAVSVTVDRKDRITTS